MCISVKIHFTVDYGFAKAAAAIQSFSLSSMLGCILGTQLFGMQSSAVSAGKKPQKRKCIDQLFVQGFFSPAAAATLVTEPSVAVSFLKNMKVIRTPSPEAQIQSSSTDTVGSNFSTPILTKVVLLLRMKAFTSLSFPTPHSNTKKY